MIDDILDVFSNLDTPFIIFLMIFSLGVAIFHTLILSSLYELKFPSWLFFVLNPALIGIAALFYKPLAGLVFVILFLSVFLLMVIGIFYSGIKGKMKDYRSEKTKYPLWKLIASILLMIAFPIAFFLLKGNLIIIIVAIIIVSKILLPSSKNRFLQLQSILPTSTIQSMAMGLVEIAGTVKHIEYILSPINSKKCIGYRYIVEKISTDSDNKKSYSKIKDETVSNDFYIEDATGKVKIKAQNLDFLWLEENEQYSKGQKRYTQYLLLENDEVLLIGKASSDNQEVFIEKELIKNIFALAPLASVNKWNKYKPLLRSFILALILIAVLSILILWANISVDGNAVSVELKNLSLFN